MLFRAEQHQLIVSGEITVSFRAWSRPQAKAGGRYRLGGEGLIEVDRVERIAVSSIDDADARRSGAADRRTLLDALGKTYRRTFDDADEVFRIEFHFAGPDNRPRPPAFDDLSDVEADEVLDRLRRMDSRSVRGAWTHETLRLIAARPRTAAAQLAAELDRERAPFKADVRKLRRLGLTLSHDVGYELSPRGRTLLAHLDRR